jgi:hypothetical protein
MRRPIDISSLLLAGIYTAMLGCESKTHRALVPPVVDVPNTEEVQTPEQITAKESLPPLHG